MLPRPLPAQTNKCAVAVRAATLRYHASAHQHSCFTQLAGFLALVEEEVAGYEPPLLITELHFHLQEAAAEYRWGRGRGRGRG